MRFFAIAICLIPSLAFSQWDMGSLEKRVSSLEDRVGAIESKLEGKTADKSAYCDCPCNSGGVCVCPPGECPNGECPKNGGRCVLFFTADWCVNCPAAKSRLGDLYEKVVPIDFDKRKDLVEKYNVTSIPQAVLVEDGEAKSRCIGEHVGKLIVGNWLNKKTASTSSRVQSSGRSVSRYSGSAWNWGNQDLRTHLLTEIRHTSKLSAAELAAIRTMSQSELQTVHDNLHNHGTSGINLGNSSRTVRYSSGSCPSGNCGGYSSGTNRTYYTPQVYYRSYGSCPTCR